jgi:hypothetical protein
VTCRPVPPCGTLRAHQLHRRAGEDPCEPCLEARRAYDRNRYVPHGPPPEPCGTDSAYQRHLRNGEKACAACLAAHAVQGRAYRKRAARVAFDQMLAEAWAEVSA